VDGFLIFNTVNKNEAGKTERGKWRLLVFSNIS